MLIQNVDVLLLCHSLISLKKAGPYRIATEIRSNGYSCQIIEAAWYFDQNELKTILDFCIGPDTKIVAWSSPYADVHEKEQWGVGFKEHLTVEFHEEFIIDYAKTINNKIKFVVGGPTAYKRQSDPGIDTVFYGMSDAAIVAYLKFLEGKNPFFQYTVQDDTMIVDGNSYNLSWEFNQSLIEYRPEDNILHGDATMIEIARGCIFKCDFCSYPLNGKKSNEYIKYKDTLYKEFLHNYTHFGIKKYIVSDDTFNDNLQKLQMMAEIAQSLPFKLELACYIRIDLIRAHPEQYQLLKDIGLAGAFFGIESLNHQSVKSIGKGLHPDKVVAELYQFRDQLPNCGTMGSFIAGLPYETKSSLENMVSLIMDHDFPVDTLRMEALTINTMRKHNLSEFEKNSSKYFSIDPSRRDSLGHEFWHNGDFDLAYANNFCQDLMKKIGNTGRNRIGGFQVMALHNYYPDLPVAHVPRNQLPVTLEMQQAKLDRYKSMVFDRKIKTQYN
jgi:radical SAM superfamily enzyme YgiQ (UPF0313 family)